MLLGMAGARISHTRSEDILCSDDNFQYGNPESIRTEILKLKTKPECYICCNDFVARNVCIALKSLQIAVPQEALVIGFDNVADSYSVPPAISTFSVDKQFLGTETMRTLIHRIEHPESPSRQITVSAKFIARASTER